MRLLLFRFLFPLLLTRLWSFHGSSNPIRKDQHFPGLTHLITIWEYVLYLLPENHYGFPQFHVAIIFCFFNPSMTVDQLVLFKNDLKCFYLAFVLHIYFDLLLWNERSWVIQFPLGWLYFCAGCHFCTKMGRLCMLTHYSWKKTFPSWCFWEAPVLKYQWSSQHSRSFWIYRQKQKPSLEFPSVKYQT